MAICNQTFSFSKILLHMDPCDMNISGQKFSRLMDWVGWVSFMATFLPCCKPSGSFSKVKNIRVVTLNELCMVITGAVVSVIPQMLRNTLVGNRYPFDNLWTTSGAHMEALWMVLSNTANSFLVSLVLYVSCLFIIRSIKYGYPVILWNIDFCCSYWWIDGWHKIYFWLYNVLSLWCSSYHILFQSQSQ